MFERAGLGAVAVVGLRRTLEDLIALIRERGLEDDPLIRQRIAEFQIGIEAMRLGALRTLTATMKTGIPGPEGSLGKWQWAKYNQALTELASEVAGPRGRHRRHRRQLPLPAQPRQLDRGRHHRGAAEHHRRARARPSEAAVSR